MKPLNERVQTHPDGSKERWRDVVGQEGRYRVSDRGRVKSLSRVVSTGNNGHRTVPTKILKPMSNRDGHLYVNSWGKLVYIHQLVMNTFVGPCPAGMQVRHLDDNRTNNRLGNLCYGTQKQNAQDRMKNYGTYHKIQTTDIPYIHALYASGLFMWEIAEMFEVTSKSIQAILHGKSYQQFQPADKVSIRFGGHRNCKEKRGR